jgi:hypothetical protein
MLKGEMMADYSAQWASNERRFETRGAEAHRHELVERWTLVRAYRVVEEATR